MGIKPVNGGSPPKDRSVNIIMMVMGVDLFHRVDSELILVIDEWLNIRNMVMVVVK